MFVAVFIRRLLALAPLMATPIDDDTVRAAINRVLQRMPTSGFWSSIRADGSGSDRALPGDGRGCRSLRRALARLGALATDTVIRAGGDRPTCPFRQIPAAIGPVPLPWPDGHRGKPTEHWYEHWSRRSAHTRAGLPEARMASGASALCGGTRFGHARVLCACCQGRLGDRQIGMMRSRRTPPVRCRDGCKATWYLLSIRGLQAWPKPLPDRVGQ
jgi:hypothetical protein